jgi:hypothetical protein
LVDNDYISRTHYLSIKEENGMKKTWGFIIASLILLLLLSTTSTAHQNAVLEIGTIDEGLLVGVASLITNVGNTTAQDVHWSIHFEGGTVLFPFGSVRNGGCKSIAAGVTKNIFSGPVCGFAIIRPMNITVSAYASNADPVQRTERGVMFLFFIQV